VLAKSQELSFGILKWPSVGNDEQYSPGHSIWREIKDEVPKDRVRGMALHLYTVRMSSCRECRRAKRPRSGPAFEGLGAGTAGPSPPWSGALCPKPGGLNGVVRSRYLWHRPQVPRTPCA
jgi:hypothetical protein